MVGVRSIFRAGLRGGVTPLKVCARVSVCAFRAGRANAEGSGAGAGEEEGPGGGRAPGERTEGCWGLQDGPAPAVGEPDEEPGAPGWPLTAVHNHNNQVLVEKVTVTKQPNVFEQATELAELTSKISLLEDAKKKKEEEAVEWQQKVRFTILHSGFLAVRFIRSLSLGRYFMFIQLRRFRSSHIEFDEWVRHYSVWWPPLLHDSLTFLCVSECGGGEGWKASTRFTSFLVKPEHASPAAFYFFFFYEQKWLMQHVVVKEMLFKSEAALLCSGKAGAAKWWFPPRAFLANAHEIPAVARLGLSCTITPITGTYVPAFLKELKEVKLLCDNEYCFEAHPDSRSFFFFYLETFRSILLIYDVFLWI